MKKILFLLVMIGLLSGCVGNKDTDTASDSTGDQELVVAPENLIRIEFNVGGMTCTGCENTVKEGIAELDGIVEVTASHLDSTAVVQFDKTKATPEQMAEVIKKKGYEVLGHEVIKE